MPELPEVETVRRGLLPHVLGRRIAQVLVRERRLRWPIANDLSAALTARSVRALERRGKYLIFRLDEIDAVVHLGMSGRLIALDSVAQRERPVGAHDHVDFLLDSGVLLRFSDPRRFGAIFCTPGAAEADARLAKLGVEPLSQEFCGDYLRAACRGRKTAIKSLLMNADVVVGIGNIYASEALFEAGVRPQRQASRLTGPQCEQLALAAKGTLLRAIEAGGTTLRDFLNGDGRPGYFSQQLAVYDRAGEPCRRCGVPIKMSRQGGRSTYFCPGCQR